MSGIARRSALHLFPATTAFHDRDGELEHAEQGEHALIVVSPPSAMIGSLTAPVEGPRCTEALRPKRIC
jgi:hypothetical protein